MFNNFFVQKILAHNSYYYFLEFLELKEAFQDFVYRYIKQHRFGPIPKHPLMVS